MESIERDLYEEAFKKWHLVPSRDVGNYGPAGTLRVLESDMGSGEYWAYFRDNLFADELRKGVDHTLSMHRAPMLGLL